MAADLLQAVGQVDVGQGLAALKGPAAKANQALRQFHMGEGLAAFKGALPNRRNILGDPDLRQGLAAIKRRFPNGRHAVRDLDSGHGNKVRKQAGDDCGHAVFNDHRSGLAPHLLRDLQIKPIHFSGAGYCEYTGLRVIGPGDVPAQTSGRFRSPCRHRSKGQDRKEHHKGQCQGKNSFTHGICLHSILFQLS